MLFLANDYSNMINISPLWKERIDYIYEKYLVKEIYEGFMTKYIKFLSIERSYIAFEEVNFKNKAGFNLNYNIEAVVFNKNFKGKMITIGFEYENLTRDSVIS